jgi:ABC-2 type transport system ATP-binding protein
MVRLAGVQLQHSSYPPRTSVEEICRLFAALYPGRPDHTALLEEFGLAGKRRAQVTKLSGGERQRLSLILALLGDPSVVFLDELTTGLDPVARRSVWEALRRRNAEGLTIMITSHFMEEVEYLCDRVAVLVKGRLAALDSVSGLIRDHAPGARLVIDGAGGDRGLRDALTGLGVRVEVSGGRLVVRVRDEETRARVDGLLTGRSDQVRTLPSSLEDAYVELTGQAAAIGAGE